MTTTKIDARQVTTHDTLTRLTGVAGSQLDDALNTINSEVTPSFALSPSTPSSKVVHIGSVAVQNPDTLITSTASPLLGVIPSFASGTITLDATGAGNATPSAGSAIALGMSASQYLKIDVSVTNGGNIVLTPGAPGSSLAAATQPTTPANVYDVGILVVRTDASNNVQNVLGSDLYQYPPSSGGFNSALYSDPNMPQFVSLQYLTSVTSSPGAGQYLSALTGRAPTVDCSQDLGVRIGTERVAFQTLRDIDGEADGNNARVQGVENDFYDRIRFVGDWAEVQDGLGITYADEYQPGTNYIEVVFYGTALNLLGAISITEATAYITVAVDGGTPGAVWDLASDNVLWAVPQQTITNQVIPIVKGLTLGTHTVQIYFPSGYDQFVAQGVEIINESTSVSVSAGAAVYDGVRHVFPTATTFSYNSGFTTQYGTSGTKGGNVVVYADTDGFIKRNVQWVDTTIGTGGASTVSHVNEEIIRAYDWREFGIGVTSGDDFSYINRFGSSNARYTLDDGLTTLAAESATQSGVNNGLEVLSDGYDLFFDFVGTGLDIEIQDDGNGGTNEFQVTIALGSTYQSVYNVIYTASSAKRRIPIVSGLPYGSHLVSIQRVGDTTYNRAFLRFIVYGPKTPAIPSGAMSLGKYNILADYSPQASPNFAYISDGVLSKAPTREAVYSPPSTWTLSSYPTADIHSVGLIASSSGATSRFAFFGTGIVFRWYGSASMTNTITFLLDGGYFTGLTTAYAGLNSASFDPTTGILSGTPNSGDAYFAVYGLPPGVHTLEAVKGFSGTPYNIAAYEVITPTHVHKNAGPFYRGPHLAIGSESVKDLRQYGNQIKKLPKTSLVTYAAQTNTYSTNSYELTPIIGLNSPFYSETGLIEISYSVYYQSPTSAQNFGFAFAVDSVIRAEKPFNTNNGYIDTPASRTNSYLTDSVIIQVSKGWHLIQIFGATGGSTTFDILYGNSTLSVRDIGNLST